MNEESETRKSTLNFTLFPQQPRGGEGNNFRVPLQKKEGWKGRLSKAGNRLKDMTKMLTSSQNLAAADFWTMTARSMVIKHGFCELEAFGATRCQSFHIRDRT